MFRLRGYAGWPDIVLVGNPFCRQKWETVNVEYSTANNKVQNVLLKQHHHQQNKIKACHCMTASYALFPMFC